MSARIGLEAPPAAVQSAPQLRYALLLEWGARAGMAVLALSFLAYVTGWLPAHVAPQRLPQLWSQPVAQYVGQTGSPTGWGWLALLHEGDMLGLAGIGILSGCSAVALLALVPMYAAMRDRAFALLALVQAMVLLVAASGWGT
ncbi:MAG: DUF1634 domain-containing protein [Burkholderiales bacterium]|nr:DUF1634 domain-containing protein [Burkholderiales bacterium]